MIVFCKCDFLLLTTSFTDGKSDITKQPKPETRVTEHCEVFQRSHNFQFETFFQALTFHQLFITFPNLGKVIKMIIEVMFLMSLSCPSLFKALFVRAPAVGGFQIV